MCGITGVINWGDRGLLAEMNALQAHRGPDDHGVWDRDVEGIGYVGLASRRLAILDLSPLGHMPMVTEDGAAAISYNGEIYNCLQLRAELERLGHRFRSRSDTEVVLHGYLEWGPECVRSHLPRN
jgi:asparagine synthase (glutamine-hydrolysing)